MPGDRYITWEYIRDVLCGKKKLLKISEVKSDYVMPRMKEYNVEQMWDEIQKDEELLNYFPYCHSKLPEKTFLFKV